MSKPPFRDPKYSGWPGPEPKDEDGANAIAERFAPEQVDLEEAVAAAPRKRKPKLEVVEE